MTISGGVVDKLPEYLKDALTFDAQSLEKWES